MIHTTSLKHVCTIVLFIMLFISNQTYACMGTGIGNATSFYNASVDETNVEIEFCLAVTDLFGMPSSFRVSFDGVSAVPSLGISSSTLSATYDFSRDATVSGFFCDCNDNEIGSSPTILSNTDTWSASTGSGLIEYNLTRSNPNLIHECQIDCANGEPTAATGGQVNYMTDISACYVISAKFTGDVEGELAGITLSGAENGICDDNLAMSFGLTGSLPVELGSFNGISKENSVEINWTTLSETAIYKYIVERSANGISKFEEIGSVSVFGNSQAIKTYKFEDTTPLAKGFYRLKTVDIDGTYSHSHIITMERTIEDIRVVNVYPNPVMDFTEIIYETKANSNVHFKIFDVNGTLKADHILDAVNGFNKIMFDFTDLRKGIYFIMLESGKEKIVRRVTKF